MPEKRTLVAIFAHPDDESYSASGTLAYYASLGVDVYIICATRGEAGNISHPSLAYRDVLGAVREEELRDACRIMGIHQPLFLGYRDSGMIGSSDNNDPLSLNMAKSSDVIGKLVGLIRQLRPDVIISYYETGPYAHPDHVSSHKYALEAFNCSGNPDMFAEQLKGSVTTFSPQRLFTVAIPTSRIEELVKAIPEDDENESRYPYQQNQEDESEEDEIHPEDVGIPDEDVTVYMDVGILYETKRQSIAAHRTQHQGEGVFSNLPENLLKDFFSQEHFFQVAPKTNPPPRYKGLFDGIWE